MSIGLPKTIERKVNHWCSRNSVPVTYPLNIKEKLYATYKPPVIVPSEEEILKMLNKTKKQVKKRKRGAKCSEKPFY